MKQRQLGPTNWQVSAIGLGAMPLSIANRPSSEAAIEVICAALQRGVNFIDTANCYCIDESDMGHNERLIAEALRQWAGPRESVIVATKGGVERPKGAWPCNGHPDHIRSACEASLKALQVESIDIYQLHAPDKAIPYAETIGMFQRLHEEGKVQHVGLSNVSVEQIRQAQSQVPIATVQNRCNPLDRRAWNEGVLAYCEAEGIAFLPYSPVGGGREKDVVANHPALLKVAQNHDASAFQIALAWLLAQSPAMIPIPGASRPSSILSSADATELQLSQEELAILDKAFPCGHQTPASLQREAPSTTAH